MSVAVGPQDQAYVVDAGNRAVWRYGADGKPDLFAGGKSESGQLPSPGDVASDAEGNIWVVAGGENAHVVDEFSGDGNYIAKITMDGCPVSVAIDGDNNLFIATNTPGTVVKFDPTGKQVDSFTKALSASGVELTPTEVRVDGKELYVCSDGGLDVFTLGGKHIRKMNLGKLPQNPTENRSIIADSVAVSSKGLIYVADGLSQQILVFNHAGTFLKSITPSSNSGKKSPRNILYPIYLTSLAMVDDQLVGLDYVTSDIYTVGPGGKSTKLLDGDDVPGGLSRLMVGGIAIAPDRRLLLADTLNHRIVVLRKD